ncbi:hypothetical protein POM88_011818 [Heracleum sosnowskyi]|uniref:Acyl-CoA oxidase C-terminal domain-containing protein n=1 Tax=Heracleum sosnowskyi TaxID=360622 RepID=A0AAD8N1X9_9APIA|nr:hypothetical protein POM88_011818 [Heracleum sosnowskyi]
MNMPSPNKGPSKGVFGYETNIVHVMYVKICGLSKTILAGKNVDGVVAADLLKQYQKKFQGGTLAVTWNYLRESMSTYMSQPNLVTSRWEGEDHLRDSTFQLDAFRYRTSRLLHSAAMRLQKHTKTLESHIESVILETFIRAVERCPDPSSRAALKLISKAIHKLTEYLSFQVRNVARELVDAFDIPDFVIRAPIGKQTPVEVYSEYRQHIGF